MTKFQKLGDRFSFVHGPIFSGRLSFPPVEYALFGVARKRSGPILLCGLFESLQLNYQFSNNLSLRLIGEYNQFHDSYFFQPLLQWNPTPFTIFYIGGASDYAADDYHPQQVVQSSQWYFKFQYAFGL